MVFFSVCWEAGFRKTGTAPHFGLNGSKSLTAGKIVKGAWKTIYDPFRPRRIVLFASVLDERQRRLFCGLESLQLGTDRNIADILHVDPHTVARGRRQLLAQDVEADRVRAVGGGRKPVGKKRRK